MALASKFHDDLTGVTDGRGLMIAALRRHRPLRHLVVRYGKTWVGQVGGHTRSVSLTNCLDRSGSAAMIVLM
jgi:hypothetical protein